MNKLSIEIDMENAAFACDDGERSHWSEGVEVARILRKYADEVEEFGIAGATPTLHDSNGNKVGRANYNS